MKDDRGKLVDPDKAANQMSGATDLLNFVSVEESPHGFSVAHSSRASNFGVTGRYSSGRPAVESYPDSSTADLARTRARIPKRQLELLQAMHERQQELLQDMQEPKDPLQERDPWTSTFTASRVNGGRGQSSARGIATEPVLPWTDGVLPRVTPTAEHVHSTETRPHQFKSCRLSRPVPKQHSAPDAARGRPSTRAVHHCAPRG